MKQDGLILAAGRVRSKKKKIEEKKSKKKKHRKIFPTQNTPRNPQQPGHRVQLETACDEHAPRVSPFSPDSIDPGFVEIGLVQLSQSVKATNSMSHTRTHIPTDKLNNGTLYVPRY